MKRAYLGFSLLAGVLATQDASACAACFGRSDSALAYGMNAGILTLLAVIGTMLAAIASFFVFIVRRASRSESESPDSDQSTTFPS
jgi:hypothetical protein